MAEIKKLTRDVVEKETLNRLETLLKKVIREEGYCEIADGVQQSIDVIKDYWEKNKIWG